MARSSSQNGGLVASDLKSNIELAIRLGKEALATAKKWEDYNAGKILVDPPISERYEISRAISRFRNACVTIDRLLESQPRTRNIKRLYEEYKEVVDRVDVYEFNNPIRPEKPKVFFTILAKDCGGETDVRFPLGSWALEILDVNAKDDDGQRLVDHGHFRFKNGTRTFPPSSKRPAVVMWKVLRALLSTTHRLGVASLSHIPNPGSAIQRKSNRIVPVEVWQDHLQACDKDGNPVKRGNGKQMYRLMREPVR